MRARASAGWLLAAAAVLCGGARGAHAWPWGARFPGAPAAAQAPAPAPALRFVAWGDDEGVTGRPPPTILGGSAGRKPNPMVPRLMERLRALDAQAPLDLLFHTGDFVRFDHAPEPWLAQLSPDLLGRFYPTGGGDEECKEGTYERFLAAAPHLRALPVGEGRPYYAAPAAGGRVFVVSLHNPDGCGERLDAAQRAWLDRTLAAPPAAPGGGRPLVVVLSHVPVWKRDDALAQALLRAEVDLVLSGDAHVLAWRREGRTLFVVTGAMGDLFIGGCRALRAYDACWPKTDVYGFDTDGPDRYDHFLDIRVEADGRIEVRPVFLNARPGRTAIGPILRPAP